MPSEPQALDHLFDILAFDQAESLESLESQADGLAESIRPSVAVPEDLQPLVDRTVEKIAQRQALDDDENFALEAIIIPDKRPVIDVLKGNRFSTDHQLWRHLNDGALHDNIVRALPSVGRVELPGHPSLPYGGTGFVVGDGLLMTNRHVAEIFASGLGLRRLNFLPGHTAAVDLERRVDGGSLPLAVVGVAMIHPYWDMALLRVEGLPPEVAPLRLSLTEPEAAADVVTIGYPAFDPRNDAQVQNQIFRNVYNVKRILPGRNTGRLEVASFGKRVNAVTHDSSTTGGASGSAIVIAATGTVAALHFGGVYKKTNYGVPAADLARDGRVIDAGVLFDGAPVRGDGPWGAYWQDTETIVPAGPRPPSPPPSRPAAASSRTISLTIPLNLTVEIGAPISTVSAPPVTVRPSTPDLVSPVEAPVSSYRDRAGYLPDFLGTAVPLPEVVAMAPDVLDFMVDGRLETELKYQHFSVKMSRRRRLCFYSAVNIDGASPRKAARVGWRLDPRIPSSQQILNECYGSPPRFSRGHMTRREDPVWGDEASAERGNADSMHVTNTVPQMQAFNSPIWLGLEDYALGHARSDAMRISVFTGPYLHDDDPHLYGVQVPVRFWKVIAFIHDRTKQLCATGYEMSQAAVLPAADAEFVFGEFRSRQAAVATQTSLAAIEARSGLSFGALKAVDPKSRLTEGLGGAEDMELEQLEQISFLS